MKSYRMGRLAAVLLRMITLGLGLACLAAAGATGAAEIEVAYIAYRFEPGEEWRTRSQGDPGDTRLEGRRWHLDFSRAAERLVLTVPDRALLTRPERFRLRVRGEAKGHPVRVALRTHFMTFEKEVGEWTGSGEQELVFEAPPGPGWTWSGGENDGKLHGPLRWASLTLAANGHHDRAELELLDLTVEGRCPSDRQCVLVADLVPGVAGEPDGFRVEARTLASAPVRGRLVWTVDDWERKELGRGGQEVELPSGGSARVIRVPVPGNLSGRRFAEATFRLEVEGQHVEPARAYWLGPVPPRADPVLRPESPFGMGVYLCRYAGAEQEEVARLAREAGVQWSREDFAWSRIEPRPGEFHWDDYDRLVEVANRNGITVYAIVGYWTSWSRDYTPEGVDQYVAYLRQLVRRYKGRIRQWEIWNEPNIFFWQGPKELYAEMLKKSYAAVKEEDSEAQVLGLSTAGIDATFIARMLELGTPFDILTIHPYRRQFDDAAFIADLRRVSDQVRQPDGTRRPVWLTEMGWATHVPHHVLRQDFEAVTPRTQAELIARTYLCSIVSGVEPRTFWYNFRNDGEDPFYFEHSMGILHRDGRPKPAYLAYATLSSMLQDLVPETAIPVGEGVFAHRFASPTNARPPVTVVWSPKTDATVTLRLPGRAVRTMNTMGESREIELSPNPAGGGVLEVSLRAGAPVYVSTVR